VPTIESTTPSDLRISVIESEGDARVSVRGRLSIDSSPDLRDGLLEILERQSVSALTIDLAGLTYMDCSGIATLAESLKIARDRNTEFLLKGLHDRPRYLLEVTSLMYLFEMKGRTQGSSVSKAS